MSDVDAEIDDLIKQATTDLSHYHRAVVSQRARAKINSLTEERDALKAALQRLYDADIATRDGDHGRRWQDALRAAKAALAGGRSDE
jgi:hypothetical protein